MRAHKAVIAIFAVNVLVQISDREAGAQNTCDVNDGACISYTNTGTYGWGVLATTTGGVAFYGEDHGTGVGVEGLANSTGTCGSYQCIGTWGGSDNGAGVYGWSENSIGVVGNGGATGANSPSYAYGVWGTSASSDGVHGDVNNSAAAVSGINSGSGNGVYGSGNTGTGVWATSTSYDGLHAQTNAASHAAVSGTNYATTGNSTAIYGHTMASGGYGGWFDGNVEVSSGWSYLYNFTCVHGACGTSDQRLKKNIEPLTNAIDKLLQIKGVTYEWKNPDNLHHAGKQTGIIAQDVEKVFPEWVSENPDGMKAVNIEQREMLGLTVEAFRTLKTENDLLKERVAALESGRQPRISGFNLNGVGFGVGGLAIGLGLMISRRKREPKPSLL